jgi:hypothetical protein
MAQQGSRAGGKHSSHPAATLAELPGPNGENPAMKGTQPAAARAMRDRARRQAELEQLCTRDDAVLPTSKPLHPIIGVLATSDRYSDTR